MKNSQLIDDVRDTVCESARGTFTVRGKKAYILYKTDTASVTMIYDGRELIMRRQGEIRSNMRFIEGEETQSEYIMPYGKLSINIATELLEAALGENGGQLRLKYILTISGEEYYNDMKIKILGVN